MFSPLVTRVLCGFNVSNKLQSDILSVLTKKGCRTFCPKHLGVIAHRVCIFTEVKSREVKRGVLCGDAGNHVSIFTSLTETFN
jgi:hypothetical protein